MMIDGIWLTEPMIPELTRELGVHRTTVARWLQKGRLPTAIRKLLDILKNGTLAHIHPAWEGWHIDPRSGDLVTPIVSMARRQTIPAREIYMTQIRFQQVRALTEKADALAARCEAQDRTIRELTERCEAQADRIATLEAELAAYTQGTVVALKPRR